MSLEDHFKKYFIPGKEDKINVAFNVDHMLKQFGGTGANISYFLKALGGHPLLLSTAGQDFEIYRNRLESYSIDCRYIKRISDEFTASCFITTDLTGNQVLSFYSGAMSHAKKAQISDVRTPFHVGIVAPNEKNAMCAYAKQLKQKKVKTVVDPGQVLPSLDKDELLSMMENASIYIVNEYEWELTKKITGLDEENILKKVSALIVTKGASGSILRKGLVDTGLRIDCNSLEIPPVHSGTVVDPTGSGDAYRSGVLMALSRNINIEVGAQLGSVMGSLNACHKGPQNLPVDIDEVKRLYAYSFGEPLPIEN